MEKFSTRITTPIARQRAIDQAQEQPDAFWKQLARTFQWHTPPMQTVSGDLGSIHHSPVTWFADGRLNLTENCLDRHLATLGDRPALLFVPNHPDEKSQTLTYRELWVEVCKTANALKGLGVARGDVVCLYMGMTPELMISVLACARLGATHSVVFGGFSALSLAGRIQDCQARWVITQDVGLRGDKIVPLKATVDEALANCPSVKKVLVHRRQETSEAAFDQKRDVWWHEVQPGASADCRPEIVEAEHPLFILYTSGSTGKPKGLVHSTAGYMAWAAYTFQNVFQMEAGDRFWCTADLGWITGHTYTTYGPLLNGVCTLMFEGVPTWPTPARFWEIIDQHQITHFYTAPTAIRALEALGASWPAKARLDSLKVLGSVGEPINEEAWQWYHQHVGKGACPIVDTWWQTETGGIMISSLAGVTPSVPAIATLPLPGVAPVLLDEKGAVIDGPVAEGNLCLQRPWPGMARTIYGDHPRYLETYFKPYPGYYFTGDGARRDERGYYRITGRVDDVVNVSGHRIGTAEVEDVINKHPSIVESAVVGRPHPIKGQGLHAFAIPTGKAHEKEILKELNERLAREIGPIAKLDFLQLTPDLPKTRSGKIMRRILRKIAEGEFQSLGDTSTLLNPGIVEALIKTRV